MSASTSGVLLHRKDKPVEGQTESLGYCATEFWAHMCKRLTWEGRFVWQQNVRDLVEAGQSLVEEQVKVMELKLSDEYMKKQVGGRSLIGFG